MQIPNSAAGLCTLELVPWTKQVILTKNWSTCLASSLPSYFSGSNCFS